MKSLMLQSLLQYDTWSKRKNFYHGVKKSCRIRLRILNWSTDAQYLIFLRNTRQPRQITGGSHDRGTFSRYRDTSKSRISHEIATKSPLLAYSFFLLRAPSFFEVEVFYGTSLNAVRKWNSSICSSWK